MRIARGTNDFLLESVEKGAAVGYASQAVVRGLAANFFCGYALGGDLERHARTTDHGAIRRATWLGGHFKGALVPLQSELRWDSEQGIQVPLDGD